MTPVEFRAYANDFLVRKSVVEFDGMTFWQSFIGSMLEVIDHSRVNDSDACMDDASMCRVGHT